MLRAGVVSLGSRPAKMKQLLVDSSVGYSSPRPRSTFITLLYVSVTLVIEAEEKLRDVIEAFSESIVVTSTHA